MRKGIVWGAVLLCLSIVLPLGGPSAQRITTLDTTTDLRMPTPVRVTNFPSVQTVAGTVSVGNLPATQQVIGEVSVTNLPLDVDGNLRVACAPQSSEPQLIGFTQGTFPGQQGVFIHSQACNIEYPGSRMCMLDEVAKTTHIPNLVPAQNAWVYDLERSRSANCQVGIGGSGAVVDGTGTFGTLNCLDTLPIACCM